MKIIITRQNIAIIIFFVINFLFSLKYSSRISEFPVLISIGLTLIYLAIWNLKNTYSTLQTAQSHYFFKCIGFAFLFCYLILSYLLFKKIDVITLNVDRWSVISSFWDCYFKGEYVYFAKSHLGNPPGPMPFYFILLLPFYLLGEVGYLTFLGLLVFIWILKHNNISVETQNTTIVLVVCSVFFFVGNFCTKQPFF